MNPKKILVLQGGNNEEHEISIATAKEVNIALKKLGYFTELLTVNPNSFIEDIKNYNPDCCFNALHGTFGEDGQIQKILFNLKIPYTHSGIRASYLGFNKESTKKEAIKIGILTPEYEVLDKNDLNYNRLFKLFKKFGSFVIKPLKSGSSFGVRIIEKEEEIRKIINNLEYSELIIEKLIYGQELTVSVLTENNNTTAIEVTEIKSNNKFFDYSAKYTKGKSQHILPASVPKDIYNQCLENARNIHISLDCNGVTRSDFIYDKINNKLNFIEINTQPGLTPISLVPEQLKYRGKDFTNLIQVLVDQARCQE